MFRRFSFVGLVALSLVIAACGGGGGGGATIEDPKEIVTKAVTALATTKTVHFKLDVTGSINADLMGSGTPSAINLGGTTVEGDLDISTPANPKLKATFAIPALLGLSGEAIVVDGSTYVKTSLTGPLYQKQALDSTPASGTTDPQKALDELKKALEQPGVTTRKLADEKCGDKDCYHVQITIAADVIKGALPSVSPAASPEASPAGMSDIVLDVWVQKSDLRPAKLATSVTLPAVGTVGLTLTLTNYDAPVTITAPPPDQVK